jgi:hypothetical protein
LNNLEVSPLLGLSTKGFIEFGVNVLVVTISEEPFKFCNGVMFPFARI